MLLLSRLHCKPSLNIVLHKKATVYGHIQLRSLDITRDLDTIYDWVNQGYAKRFWQMDGSKKSLVNTYEQMLLNSHAHPFVLVLGKRIIAQVDLYQLLADELQDHVSAYTTDCGLHILMLPPRESKKGLASLVLKTFIEWYFSFTASERLYAEPDKENGPANLLARHVGFVFQKEIILSYKTANLYCYEKNQII